MCADFRDTATDLREMLIPASLPVLIFVCTPRRDSPVSPLTRELYVFHALNAKHLDITHCSFSSAVSSVWNSVLREIRYIQSTTEFQHCSKDCTFAI